MTWGLVLEIAVLAAVAALFYAGWKMCREHDRAERAKEKARRDVELVAIRRVGMDRNRPTDIYV